MHLWVSAAMPHMLKIPCAKIIAATIMIFQHCRLALFINIYIAMPYLYRSVNVFSQ